MQYFAEQSSGNINLILAEMTSLMDENARKTDQLQNQNWFHRMSNTLLGKNKMTQQEIQNNHDKISLYTTQVMTELFNQNKLSQQVMSAWATG